MKSIKKIKQALREEIWNKLEKLGLARFPLPIKGRIPNFQSAEKAANNLRNLKQWKKAKVIKCNPDAPQQRVRFNALKDGKLLIVPSPRIKKGFLVLDPRKIDARNFFSASTIKGAFKFGSPVALTELKKIKIDLVVVGSVAVNKFGARIGKAGGYSDREYAILKELGHGDVPVATTVHEIQIVDKEIPLEKNDLPVDFIVTSKEIIETKTPYPKPEGIYWDLVSEKDLEAIPLLRELKELKEKKF